MTLVGEFAGTDRFEPVRRLGAGGMGVVFEVFDRERDEHVALKTLRHASAQSLYYLKKEFRALEGMHHPNLIRLLELIESEGHWFFTMELVRGANLLTYVRGREHEEVADTLAVDAATSVPEADAGAAPAWDEQRLRRGLAGVLDGLSALHECGMIHRDIKPSNVMVDAGDRVVLLDFGLAEALARRRHVDGEGQRLMGTPAYMSPEQFDSSELSPASDLYSVGVTLYEAITGRLPHSGAIAEVMESCKTPPRRPSELAPGVPADLDELCMALLRYDPAERPTLDDARRALGAAVVGPRYRRPLTPRPGARGDAAFVGRARDLDELRALFERVRSGSPVSVLVEGASGIGKTALVRHFLRTVEDTSDAVLLMGRCYESESVPYKAFDSLVDELGSYLRGLPKSTLAELLPDGAGALVRLFPVLEPPGGAAAAAPASTSPSDLRARAFAALRELLRRLASRVALVLFIDDLHWGDADSGALLRELLRQPDAPAMMFIATYRGDTADDPMIVSATSEHHRIRLDALPSTESRELIGRISGAQRSKLAPWLDDIVREAKGNPFFIGEIVRYLAARRDADDAEGAVLLQRVVEERVAALPDDAAEALRAAAVIGRPVPRELLCDVADLDTADGRRAIDTLVAANMLRNDRDSRVGVYHDRLREVVVAELPPRKVRDVYRRMHAALERSGSDARHAELLGLDYVAESDPARALEYAVRAAELAEAAFAFGRAARLYQLAVELAPETERRGLMRRHARVLHDGGYGADAARVYLELAAGSEVEDALELTRLAADDLLRSGHIEQGLARLGDVARQLGVKVGRSRARTVLGIVVNRARLRLRGLRYTSRSEAECEPHDLARLDTLFAAATALGIVDHLNGTLMQTEHLLGALRVGEERRVWRAIAAEVVFLSAQGGRAVARAERLHGRLTKRADELDDAFLRAGALIGQGYLGLFGGRYRDARAGFEAAQRALQDCPDAWWERNTARYWGLLTAVTMGDYNEVATALPRMVQAAEERNDRYMRSVLRTHPTVFHMLRENRTADADAELDAALENWTGERRYVAHYTVMISRVALRLYEQRSDDALRILDGARSLMRELLVHRVPFAKSEVDKLTAVAAVARGDGPRAVRAIRALERFGIPISRAYGAMYRAPLALARGDRDEARRLIESAIPIFEESGAAHDVAAARYRAGQLRGGADGDALAESASGWFRAQGVVDVARMIDYVAPGFPPASTS